MRLPKNSCGEAGASRKLGSDRPASPEPPNGHTAQVIAQGPSWSGSTPHSRQSAATKPPSSYFEVQPTRCPQKNMSNASHCLPCTRACFAYKEIHTPEHRGPLTARQPQPPETTSPLSLSSVPGFLFFSNHTSYFLSRLSLQHISWDPVFFLRLSTSTIMHFSPAVALLVALTPSCLLAAPTRTTPQDVQRRSESDDSDSSSNYVISSISGTWQEASSCDLSSVSMPLGTSYPSHFTPTHPNPAQQPC